MNNGAGNTFERTFFEAFRSISDIVSVSIILSDRNKEIKNSNAKANRFLGLSSGVTSLFEIFPAEEHTKLNRAVEECSRVVGGIKEIMNVRDETGKVVKCEVMFRETRGDDGNPYYVLSINPHLYQTSEVAPIHITANNEELATFINNKRVIQLIDDIRSNYPFTFIGKNKIQQEANKLDELLWLKDSSDTYVLVNKKFGDALGLRPGQIEGRLERNYLPLYFLDFYKSLDNYMRDTLNCVIIEGIPYRGFSSWQNYQTIEIPLYDSDNNLLAVIGLSQRIQRSTGAGDSASGSTAVMEKIAVPVALFDQSLNYVSGSPSFRQLFPKIPLANLRLSDILNDADLRKTDEFLQTKPGSMTLDIEIPFKNDETLIYSCTFQKSFLPDEEVPQVLLTFEKKLAYDSVEDLIRYKGRMYDTLIQLNPEPIFIYDSENLRFLEVNEAALQLYGYKRDEFLQMDLTDLYSTEDIQSLLESSPGKETIPQFNGPYKQRKKDGKILHVKIAKSAFVFEGREAHFNIVRNLSEDATKGVDSIIYKSVYEHTSDIVLVTDSTGFIQETNGQAAAILGYSPAELVNSSVVEYVIDDDRSRLNTSIFFSGAEEPVTVDLSFKNSSGKVIRAQVHAVPIIDTAQNIEIYNLIIRPEPEEIVREVEKEVIKEIIKEVYLPADPDVSATSGTTASGSGVIDPKQIGTIFHEILTPINVILGFVQELKDSIEQPTQEQIEASDYISQNRENMMDIMNSISEYSQLSASAELEPHEVSVVEIIETIQKEEAEFFTSIDKRLTPGKLSSSLSIFSDRQKFKMLLNYLCKTALRITDEPQIYLSAAQYDDFRFILSFRDNFSKVSDKLMSNFESFLNGTNPVSPKNFQLSRYSFATLKLLLKKLNGTFEPVMRSGKPYEIGFVFPLSLGQQMPDTLSVQKEFEQQQFEPYTTREITPEPEFENVVLRRTSAVPPAVPQEPAKHNEWASLSDRMDEIEVPKDGQYNFKSAGDDSSGIKTSAPSITRHEETGGHGEWQQHEDPAAHAQPPDTQKATLLTKEELPALKLSGLNCLYIEDQVDSQILFKVQLKEMKEIKFAVSFEEALPMLTSQKFDFIVMDINLQGEYNGLDALKMIRRMPGLDMPIVAVTAYVLPGDKEKFILAGFDDFISKPIFREKLIEVMEKLFKRKIAV